MRYVIVGAGPAGVVAAETLRAKDPESEVVLIGAEPGPAYSRMAIPYLLSNQIEESGTYLRHDPDHFESLGIRQIHDQVTSVNGAKQSIDLAGNGGLDYDRLLVATGSHPVAPPVKGLDQPDIHHCWTLEDARNIAKAAQPGTRVVLMGAGFIGCILMDALIKREVDLTVVELEDRLVPRMTDLTAGTLIKKWLESKNVDVRTSIKVISVEPDDTGAARYKLNCESSDPIPADLVVVATGVRPITGLLKGSGVEIKRGVLVDEYLQTSVPGVYAAGDVCECLDWGTGEHTINAIQPVAVETGRIAAMNMTGLEIPYVGIFSMNVLDVVGLVCASYGQWQGIPGGDECHLINEQQYRYVKLQFEKDRLIGALTLGATEHTGILRGLIQGEVKLGEWKDRLMANPIRVMEAYLASSRLAGVA
jgi:NADPH-dependent 2,4-dienoyl-CoA reductase/sulfur reductase-like enzyme